MKLTANLLRTRQDRGGLEIRSGLRDQRVPGLRPDTLEELLRKRVWCMSRWYSVGVWRGGCPFRCCHLTIIQNYE
ncbi:hypothetical protein AVEN_15150-1, partial [Araneus ventricosus]